MRQLVREGNSPVAANGLSMLLGGIPCFFASWFIEQWQPIPVTHGNPFISYYKQFNSYQVKGFCIFDDSAHLFRTKSTDAREK